MRSLLKQHSEQEVDTTLTKMLGEVILLTAVFRTNRQMARVATSNVVFEIGVISAMGLLSPSCDLFRGLVLRFFGHSLSFMNICVILVSRQK